MIPSLIVIVSSIGVIVASIMTIRYSDERAAPRLQGGPLICQDCRNKLHRNCRGGTWCDCQHLPASAIPQQEPPAQDHTPAEPDGGADAQA